MSSPASMSVMHRPKRRYRNSSPMVARVIRDLYFVGRLKQKELARMFGLAQSSVSRIVAAQVWQH
jgi:DNA-binding transcriptional regulator LsrR (DeoR family)